MTTDPTPHRLTVVGAGVMGTGIATLAIGHGVPVRLIDVDRPTLDRARSSIAAQLRHARLLTALPEHDEGELVTTTTIAEAAGSTAVIEAVTEAPKIKDAVLGEVSAAIAPGTPLISNTSGIPIDELADSVRDPGTLLGTHFMNPTYLIDMVEVIAGPRTTGSALAAADALLAAMGRRRVVVRDSPGFVTSRLLHPMINAAARLVGDGVAPAEDVDALMQGCLGHPTGPLRTADLIGIDNLVDSLEVLHERTGDENCRPCAALRAKVRDGHLGRKSGRGFYEYERALLS
ncbi:3-hydroxyacyl-CoA dehydrogenase family protein [Saccharopolyspora indica]|uniref:3-hydroxyacyl-CoA dehydrogenase family protein n=1 Tax=Saccharopolyspora indica TaxID=1229659 RepID=UPI0022EA71C5|nr:3-hydroxyacyl-CoA dehydrogenase family protein [Saccharopolyspora indica]MDA3647913.1 3-hydroxyacyl-CoA dehydrogenase family protein [Saccharopolyspora indica]